MNHKRMHYVSIAALLFSLCSAPNTTTALTNKDINPDIKGGKVLIFSTDGKYIDLANVGNLPDMITFTPDGKHILSANEGEPSADYKIDPKGSISIIHLAGNKVQRVKTLSFDDIPLPADIRIKPGTNPAQDLEPEHITINKAGTKAWVSLQENNAFAIIDLVQERLESVVSLGVKDFNAIDINTQDGAYTSLYLAGTRSFSIRDSNGKLIYDSGADFLSMR